MSSEKLYLVHSKTSRKYEVLGVDRDAGVIHLKGELASFTEQYNPQRFKELGYTLKKEQVDA